MTEETPFLELANLCRKLEETTKRKEKTRLISSFLRKLREEEIAPAVHLLVGTVFPEWDQKVLEIGGRTVWKIIDRSKQVTLISKPLTILGVHEYFEKIAAVSGKGSRKRKESLVESLLSQASPIEAEYLVRIMFGEMRIGVVEGVMLEAIAEAAGVNLELVRRSYMLLGDLGEIALTALKKGEEGLRRVNVQLFKPIKPMLAEMSYSIAEVLASHGGKTAFEYKFDGARIQIHKKENEIRIFSRRLTDVTESLPDIVELVQSKIAAKNALLEGEVIAVGADEKPLPFQDLMRRFRRVHKIDEMVKEIPLKLYLFDVIYLDGKSLINTPYEERWKLLSKICENRLLAERIVTSQVSEAESFLKRAMEAGHEGLMAKALKSDYTPGVRGKKWFKIKPADYLDLVIVAADWGYGRRTGWLSNYHLAARDEKTGEFLVVGKTFKGLTDEEFTEMTKRLQEIKTSESEYTVYVKPSIVVEIAYNEIQKSPHYKSGFALRFARITRIRKDKSPQEADTITRIKQLYEKQFEHKAKRPFIQKGLLSASILRMTR
jgi:DNA ligase-1